MLFWSLSKTNVGAVHVLVRHFFWNATYCLKSAKNSSRPKTCKQCGPCFIKDDRGKCKYCSDKPKFGGPGKLKRKCINKESVVVAVWKNKQISKRCKRKYQYLSEDAKNKRKQQMKSFFIRTITPICQKSEGGKALSLCKAEKYAAMPEGKKCTQFICTQFI